MVVFANEATLGQASMQRGVVGLPKVLSLVQSAAASVRIVFNVNSATLQEIACTYRTYTRWGCL